MKSKMALSSMCRACAQPSALISSPRALVPLATTTRSQQPIHPQHRDSQATRSFSTTPSNRETTPYDTTKLFTPIPSDLPSNLTPPQLLSLPHLLPTYPSPSYTATVTSLHASTVHATRTVPLHDAHLRKSFLTTTHDLVHDPYSLLRVGDVIRYTPFTDAENAAREKVKEELDQKRMERLKAKRRLVGRPKAGDGKPSKRVRVRFVLRQVVSAFGEGLDERMAKRIQDPEGQVGKGKKRTGRSIVAEVQAREGLLSEEARIPGQMGMGEGEARQIVA